MTEIISTLFDIEQHELDNVIHHESQDTWEVSYAQRAEEILIAQWDGAEILSKGYEISLWPRVYDGIIVVYFTRKRPDHHLVITLDDGITFEGTIDHWRNSFFDNCTLENVFEFARRNGMKLRIDVRNTE